MPEQNKPFVVTDRRKFSLDGTPRPDAEREPVEEATPAAASTPLEPVSTPAPTPEPEPEPVAATDPDMPPPPTQQEMEQALSAYQQTSERLETAVRAANPGAERPPAMTFDQIVQSIFMTALMQLGATAPEGQQPRVDLMGARQSIDMLGILAEKTRGNLDAGESQLMENALFEVRMGFLEVTQALARSAATRVPEGPGGAGFGGGPGKPSIVR
jgi:hypothetical protein